LDRSTGQTDAVADDGVGGSLGVEASDDLRALSHRQLLGRLAGTGPLDGEHVDLVAP
jgi:hypothetical protein